MDAGSFPSAGKFREDGTRLWINVGEKLYPRLIPHLSTCKSPMMMLGATVRPYFAARHGIRRSDCFVVALMPCVAKKDEIERMQLRGEVDAVLTAREFVNMMKMMGLDWHTTRTSVFDSIMGKSSGVGALFSVSGGVTEAAVRYAYTQMTKQRLRKMEFKQFRGSPGLRTGEITFGDAVLKIAVCGGIAAARDLIDPGAIIRSRS
jgi:iron only hydrogenase large subunit-like protein